MLKIGICDNESEILNDIRIMLTKLTIKLNIDFDTYYFLDAKDLLDFYEDHCLDILLLDIEFEDSDGIEIAGVIRNYFKDSNVKIIFITSHSENVFRSFDVKAYHFLVKPLSEIKLTSILSTLYSEIQISNDENSTVFTIKGSLEKRIIKNSKVVSLELIDSPKRALRVTTEDDLFEASGRLNHYWNELSNQNFYMIYRSIIINLDYLLKIKNNSVVMDNGVEFPLSRRYKKNLKTIYSSFIIANNKRDG